MRKRRHLIQVDLSLQEFVGFWCLDSALPSFELDLLGLGRDLRQSWSLNDNGGLEYSASYEARVW